MDGARGYSALYPRRSRGRTPRFQRPTTFFRRLILGDLNRRILLVSPSQGEGAWIRPEAAMGMELSGAAMVLAGGSKRRACLRRTGRRRVARGPGSSAGATGRGIVNPPIANRRGSRRIADRSWLAPVRGLLGIRAERRSLGPILTQEQLLRSGQVEPKRKHTSRSPGSSRPLRVLPTNSASDRVRPRSRVRQDPLPVGEVSPKGRRRGAAMNRRDFPLRPCGPPPPSGRGSLAQNPLWRFAFPYVYSPIKN